jgi:protein-disulfide isomerase/uncharacterized membrane protein
MTTEPPTPLPAGVPTDALRTWALGLIFPVTLVGAAIGGLMTWHHDTQLYGASEAAELVGCVQSATVNCDIVNTSAWSELGGVPIATLAIAAYAAVATIAGYALAKRSQGASTVLLGAGLISVLCSAFLFYQSKIELGYVCAWCLRLYGVNGVLFVLSLLASRKPWPLTLDPTAIGVGLGGLAAFSLVGAGGERVYRGSIAGGGASGLSEVHAGEFIEDPKVPPPSTPYAVTTEAGTPGTITLDADDAWRGNRDAKVWLVEFADLECGYCKRTSVEVDRLYAAYGDRVLFVFKHFPMNPDCNSSVQNRKHKYACEAAKAATCARSQGKFWDFATLAFKNQHQLGPEYLQNYATTVGVDTDAWRACMRDPATLASVQSDAAAGGALGVKGTPRIYLDGKLYRSGTSAEAMARAIEQALGADASAANTAAAKLHDESPSVAPIEADLPDMRLIEANGLRFKIDSLEASLVDGKAAVGKHQLPAVRTSWFAAKAACESAGKRMCTEEEWVTACQGARALDDNHNGEFADDMIEGTAYPYGDYHDAKACWDGHDRDSEPRPESDPWRPVYTGEMPACVTPSGVYDLTGNVEEWVGDTAERAALLGGSFDTPDDKARCYRRNNTFGAGYANPRTGFRCCANP